MNPNNGRQEGHEGWSREKQGMYDTIDVGDAKVWTDNGLYEVERHMDLRVLEVLEGSGPYSMDKCVGFVDKEISPM
ncbi:hypothetical protein V6N13_061183 [Hibiscus sabdariffa]|uniref:Uncharacterized protein n=1 Tax=Hibiscus sabdariffa TaxID=183260 RepID=A0ABR2EG41_9ROSI